MRFRPNKAFTRISVIEFWYKLETLDASRNPTESCSPFVSVGGKTERG